MPLFESSRAAALTPGPHIIDIAQPNQIGGVSQGRIGIAMQTEWGPPNVAYEPLNPADFVQTYFPNGCARTSTGWLATTRRKKAPWTPCRVLHADALKASCTASGAYGNVDAVAASEGTLGNSITLTVAAASGGDTAKRKLTATLTNTNTGTTTEVYDNVAAGDVPVVAGIRAADGQKSYLLYSLSVWSGLTSWPTNGTYSFTGGSNGSAITANDYDNAFAQLDSQTNILVYVADDCGDSIRAAVNTNIYTRVIAKTDRFGILQSNKADGWGTVKGNSGAGVGVNRHKLIRFCNWVNVRDFSNVEQKSPFGTFMASVMANLDPKEPDAWWDDKVTEFLTGISSLDTTVYNPMDETIQGDATTLGVCLAVKLPDAPPTNGRFAALHDRTTSLTVSQRFTMTQKIRRFWALAIKAGLAPWTNGANDAASQREAERALVRFMNDEVRNGRVAIQTASTVRDYPLWAVGEPMFSTDIVTPNTAPSIAAGEFAIALNAIVPSVMEKIFVLFNVGTQITIAG